MASLTFCEETHCCNKCLKHEINIMVFKAYSKKYRKRNDLEFQITNSIQ